MGLIGWLVALGCLLVGTAVGVWGFTEINRSITIFGIGFPGAVMILLGLCFELQKFDNPTDSNNRAHVFVDASEIRHFMDGIPEGWVSLKNSGPALATSLERKGQIMLTPFPAQNFPELEWKGAKGSLAPNGEVYFGPIPLPRELTPAERLDVVTGKSAIYLWGELRYTDVSKKTHTTKFKVFYRGNGKPVPPGTVLPTQQTSDDNDSD